MPMPMSPRRRALALFATLTAFVALTISERTPAAERGPSRQTTAPAGASNDARVIVKFKADSGVVRALSATASGSSATGPQSAQTLSTRLGLSLSDGRVIDPRAQVILGSGMRSEDLAAQLAAQSDVEYAVVDGRKRAFAATPNDPLYLNAAATQTPAAGQWYLQAPTSTLVASINAEAAWAVSTGSSSLVVADLDTGVRFDHPDLTTKLLAGYDFVSDASTANDGGGRDADASDPGDWITSAENASGTFAGCGASDSSWHGTQTAGLIGAATNNGIGMASVGRDVTVLPVRVLGKCGGYDSDIIAAMRWAAGLSVAGVPANTHAAKVINMSLGGAETCSTAYQDAVTEVLAANVVIVAAAGNDGLAVGAPANCSGVIAVVGVRHTGTKVGYSSLGPAATVAAPAGNCVNTTGTCLYPILTTSNSGTTSPVSGSAGAVYTSGGEEASLGTSFSSPLVSGTVALMLSANPNLTPAQVKSALQSSARAFPSTGAGTGVSACTAPTSVAQSSECYCTTATCGAGLLDAGAAIKSVAPATATIGVASTAVVAGTAVSLDGSGSKGGGSATVASYLWQITSGSAIAAFTSATNAASATLLPSAAGTVVAQLSIVDTAGNQASSSVSLTVTAAPTSTTSPVASSGSASTEASSGGGGAIDIGMLLGWLASVIVLCCVRRRQARPGEAAKALVERAPDAD